MPGKPAGIFFPHGLFAFSITNIKPGSTVTVYINLPQKLLPDGQYWQFQNDNWIAIPISSGAGTGSIAIQLTDGGLGDADGAANGTIVDPGGPAIYGTTSAATAAIDSSSSLSSLPEHIMQSGPDLSITGLNASPVQAGINQPVTIYANIVNRGETPTAFNADLKINGKVEQNRTGNIGSNSVQRLKFTVYPDKAGTYNVDINGAVTSFNVSGDDREGHASTIMLIVFIALTIPVILLAAMIIRRRKA